MNALFLNSQRLKDVGGEAFYPLLEDEWVYVALLDLFPVSIRLINKKFVDFKLNI